MLSTYGLAVGSCELAFAMGLDSVEQHPVDHAQCARYCRNALAVVHLARCLLLEFERVAPRVRLKRFRFNRQLN